MDNAAASIPGIFFRCECKADGSRAYRSLRRLPTKEAAGMFMRTQQGFRKPPKLELALSGLP